LCRGAGEQRRNESNLSPAPPHLCPIKRLKLVRNAGEALRELARSFKDDTNTKPFLKKHATSDQDSCNSPDEAVKELARGWKDDPDTLSFLKELATSDKYSINVQLSAVQELARTFNQEPGMFEFLRVIAVPQPSKGDNLFDNRSVVLQVIIKQFPHHRQTLPLLRDRTENDPDEQVREFAQKKLKQLEG
jgi:hypothetical protein